MRSALRWQRFRGKRGSSDSAHDSFTPERAATAAVGVVVPHTLPPAANTHSCKLGE